ncbi:MAG: ATP-binding protein, partial [Lachnospiraceae bacterium]|nr:ATP-binding protein [Lachnospiraceae bacterium]
MAKKKEDYGADSIAVLEGLEAVRVRPGMYIGSTTRKGLNHMIYEIVDNSVDEHLAGYCDTIHVTLNDDGSCTVEDNGRGIPVGMHAKGVSAERVVFTTLHAGGKFDHSAYKTSGGLHGVGSSVVNALSDWMDVEIRRDGHIYHDRYEKGKPAEKLENGLLPVIGNTRQTGTKITFLPDPTI